MSTIAVTNVKHPSAVDPNMVLDAAGGLVDVNGVPWGNKILQIVHSETTTGASTTSSTHTDTNLTATITPSSVSSKIFVLFNQNGIRRNSGASSSGIGIKLLRDGTDIGDYVEYIGYTATSLELNIATISGTKLDEPATTSAVVYKTQFRSSGSSGGVVAVQQNGGRSTMTLIEVSA